MLYRLAAFAARSYQMEEREGGLKVEKLCSVFVCRKCDEEVTEK